MKKAILSLTIFLSYQFSYSQLVVNNTTLTPAQLVQNVLLGIGVTASNITYNGSAANANVVQPAVGQFNGTAANVGLLGGVLMGSGNVQVAVGPNNQGGASLGGNGGAGIDPDLAAITPNQIYDEAILEFDFVPQGDSIKFKYVFASEEYDEYVCGSVNDAFGFFVSGPGFAGPYTNGAENIALIPGTNTPVSINTVNLGIAGTNGTAANCSAIDPNWAVYNVYYSQNTQQTVQYDGMTVVLTAQAAVLCGETYHIKLAIGDAGDGIFDSGVFLEEGSFASSGGVDVEVVTVNGDTTLVEGCFPAIFSFTRPDDSFQQTIYFGIGGTATNGSDYAQVADSIVFPVGVDTVQIVISTFDDDATAGIEAPESIIITTYSINQCGDTTVNIGQIWIVEPDEIVLSSNDVVLNCPQSTVNISVNATGGVPGYTYNWDVGGTTSTISVPGNVNGTYIVTVSDTCGLTSVNDTIEVTLLVPPPPVVSVPDTVFNCTGVTIGATATDGSSPYTYSWSTGGTTDTISYNPVSEGYVYVSVTDNCGVVSNTDSTFIEFPDPLILSSVDESVLCPGDAVTLNVQATGGATPYAYSWSSGGNTSSETISPLISGNYIVVVTDNCGASEDDTIAVTVPVYTPLVLEVVGDTLICIGTAGTMAGNTSGGAGNTIFLWDNFGNGALSTTSSSQVSVTPIAPGYIWLSVTDQCGNTTSDSLFINLQVCDILIPNVFSPNGDGSNELFFIVGLEYYPNSHLKVFNRWGRIVYENENYQNNWNGGDVSDGTYYYILDTQDENLGIKTGYVTVLRVKN